MYTILIIEDEPRVASLLMNGLEGKWLSDNGGL